MASEILLFTTGVSQLYFRAPLIKITFHKLSVQCSVSVSHIK